MNVVCPDSAVGPLEQQLLPKDSKEIHVPMRRDRLVVRTLRCGRSNPGSNPGHGIGTYLFNPLNQMTQ